MTRRAFLTVTGVGAVGVGLGATGLVHFLGHRSQGSGVTPPRTSSDRVLVIIEMAGGNDGMSMVVPYTNHTYYGLRPNTSIRPDQVLRLNDRVGLHPALARLQKRGVAAVLGVGIPNPDLSHFEMLRRLWAGDFDGNNQTTTGVFGRLCDAVGDPNAAAVGVSLAVGPSPTLSAEKTITASLDPNSAMFPLPDDGDLQQVWLAGFRAMAQQDRNETAQMLAVRRGASDALRLADVINNLAPAAAGYPENNDLATQLQFAARIIASKVGVRVIHVPMSGDFDTHENHVSRAAANMGMLDAAVDVFLGDLAARGLDKSVLIMTTSEFGRRVQENGNAGDAGLDHGAASALLMIGAAKPGVYGELPDFDKLDDDGDLRFTVHYADYLATGIEGWFGVHAGDILPGSPKPLAGIV